MNENSTSRVFHEAPSNQELRMATPSKKSKNTNKKRKKFEKMRKVFVKFAMSNTTIRWTSTTVHHGLGAKLQSMTIGSICSVLASLRKIQRVSVNGFVKIQSN